MVASNTLRAIKKCSTVFVTDLLLIDHKEATVISRVIQRCKSTEYRVWLRCMTGIYPVQTYLPRIGVVHSPICPHCDERVPESLTHFACLCPTFREARTSAHNQVHDVITSFLTSALRPTWTRMEKTVLRSTSRADVDQLGRRQPIWILVSEVHKKIATVDLNPPMCTRPSC